MTLMAHVSTIVQTVLTVLDVEEEETVPALGPAFAESFWPVVALAAAMFLLGWDLMRRLRRAKYRAEISEELAPEVAAMEAARAAEAANAATQSEQDGQSVSDDSGDSRTDGSDADGSGSGGSDSGETSRP